MTDQERSDFRRILVALLNVMEIDNHEMLLACDTAFNAHLMAVENRKLDTEPETTGTKGE